MAFEKEPEQELLESARKQEQREKQAGQEIEPAEHEGGKEHESSRQERPTHTQEQQPAPEQDAPTPAHAPAKKSKQKPQDSIDEEEVKEVEKILEDDLADVYVTLDPKQQQEFKEQGEETAREIVSLMHHMKIKAQKVLKLILRWLKIIPGVSKFFIEQEAKIKADKILELHEKEHHDQQ